jgi:hypothetical protein
MRKGMKRRNLKRFLWDMSVNSKITAVIKPISVAATAVKTAMLTLFKKIREILELKVDTSSEKLSKLRKIEKRRMRGKRTRRNKKAKVVYFKISI